jgi:hypothetical protein
MGNTPHLMNWNWNKYPQVYNGVLVQVENGDKLFWK